MLRKMNLVWSLTMGFVSLCAASVIAAAPPDKDLVVKYTFDDINGKKIVDTSGHKLDAVLEGNATQIAGVSGKALQFDGEENYATLPMTTLNNLKELSVAAWVKVDERRMWSRAWDLGASTENFMFFSPYCGQQAVLFEFKPENQSLQAARSPQFEVGNWHHVVATAKGKDIKLFIDGKLSAWNSYGEDFDPDLSAFANMEQIWLGKSQYAADALFKGGMDDFRIYSRALTDAEVASLATK